MAVYRLLALSKREYELLVDLLKTKESCSFDGAYEDIYDDFERKVTKYDMD